jgi:Zn-dependent protease
MFLDYNIIDWAAKVPAIVIVVVLHEYIKALVSTKLGDPIPREKGRLTLNPVKHIDPLGALCIFFWGFGWGNPVQTSPIHYKDRTKGTIFTYVIPSVANLFFGMAFAIALKFFKNNFADTIDIHTASDAVYFSTLAVEKIITHIAFYNVAIALFNIIPVYPMDGYKIINLFLPATTIIKLQQNEKIIQIILMIFVILGVIGTVLNPIVCLLTGITP